MATVTFVASVNKTRTNLDHEQNARLVDDLLRASSLRKHKIPRWVQRRLRRIPDNLIGFTTHGSVWWLVGIHDWLDHWGYYLADDGREVFVSEPYDVETETIEQALAFARQIEAAIHISPVSAHYPGRTVRIEFWPGRHLRGEPDWEFSEP